MKNKLLTYSPVLLWVTFVIGCFLFIESNFKYWYSFMEQYLMFQTTDLYFFNKLAEPGGLTQYVAEFLSISFAYPMGASIILAVLLGGATACFYLYLKKCGFKTSMLVAILPGFLFWWFPQESITPLLTVLIVLGTAVAYASVACKKLRYSIGLVLLTLTYFTSAPAPLLAAVLMGIYECTQANKERLWIALAGVAYSCVFRYWPCGHSTSFRCRKLT